MYEQNVQADQPVNDKPQEQAQAYFSSDEDSDPVPQYDTYEETMAAYEKEEAKREAERPPPAYKKVIALWNSPTFVNDFPRTKLYTWLTIFDPADHPLEITPTERDDVVYKNLCCILNKLREKDGTVPYCLAGFLD